MYIDRRLTNDLHLARDPFKAELPDSAALSRAATRNSSVRLFVGTIHVILVTFQSRAADEREPGGYNEVVVAY